MCKETVNKLLIASRRWWLFKRLIAEPFVEHGGGNLEDRCPPKHSIWHEHFHDHVSQQHAKEVYHDNNSKSGDELISMKGIYFEDSVKEGQNNITKSRWVIWYMCVLVGKECSGISGRSCMDCACNNQVCIWLVDHGTWCFVVSSGFTFGDNWWTRNVCVCRQLSSVVNAHIFFLLTAFWLVDISVVVGLRFVWSRVRVMSFEILLDGSSVIHFDVYLVQSWLFNVHSWTSGHLKPWTAQDVITLCSHIHVSSILTRCVVENPRKWCPVFRSLTPLPLRAKIILYISWGDWCIRIEFVTRVNLSNPVFPRAIVHNSQCVVFSQRYLDSHGPTSINIHQISDVSKGHDASLMPAVYDTSVNIKMSLWIDQMTICSMSVFRNRNSPVIPRPLHNSATKEIDNVADRADQWSARHVRSFATRTHKYPPLRGNKEKDASHRWNCAAWTLTTLLDWWVSTLAQGHANLLCIVPRHWLRQGRVKRRQQRYRDAQSHVFSICSPLSTR